MGERWIQEAQAGEGKAWSLHAMLNIPDRKRIPKTLLRRIKNTDIGKTIRNPTLTGKRYIQVTRKLKQKVMFAWNANYA